MRNASPVERIMHYVSFVAHSSDVFKPLRANAARFAGTGSLAVQSRFVPMRLDTLVGGTMRRCFEVGRECPTLPRVLPG